MGQGFRLSVIPDSPPPRHPSQYNVDLYKRMSCGPSPAPTPEPTPTPVPTVPCIQFLTLEMGSIYGEEGWNGAQFTWSDHETGEVLKSGEV